MKRENQIFPNFLFYRPEDIKQVFTDENIEELIKKTKTQLPKSKITLKIFKRTISNGTIYPEIKTRELERKEALKFFLNERLFLNIECSQERPFTIAQEEKHLASLSKKIDLLKENIDVFLKRGSTVYQLTDSLNSNVKKDAPLSMTFQYLKTSITGGFPKIII